MTDDLVRPRRLRKGKPRPPEATRILMRRAHGDSGYRRSTTHRRLRLVAKVAHGVADHSPGVGKMVPDGVTGGSDADQA